VAAPVGGVAGSLLLPMNKGGRCFTACERDACSGVKLPEFLPSARRESYLRSAGASERHHSRILFAEPPVTT
jgi:hypothetical protein